MSVKWLNHVYSGVCLLAGVYVAIPQSAWEIVPPKLKEYLVGLFLGAMWMKSHWNLFVSPVDVNGTEPLVKIVRSGE